MKQRRSGSSAGATGDIAKHGARGQYLLHPLTVTSKGATSSHRNMMWGRGYIDSAWSVTGELNTVVRLKKTKRRARALDIENKLVSFLGQYVFF